MHIHEHGFFGIRKGNNSVELMMIKAGTIAMSWTGSERTGDPNQESC